MTAPAMTHAKLVEWLSTVDLRGYSTAALQAAYDALVGDTEAPPDDGEPS